MKKYILPEKDTWNSILQRPAANYAELEKTVRKILQKVKEKGDKATRKYTKSFDGVVIKKLRITEKEISNAASLISPELKEAINQAKSNIYDFHVAQEVKTEVIETMPGVKCWRKPVPIERIGLYIPGGSAPLFSTVLMLGIPAMIAGCKNIVLCTPPGRDGKIHPAILYAAACCGIANVFKVGGVQAIGAMAYGTETIDRVFKIF